MSKRMRVLIAVLVAVVLLTVGSAAVVMADDGSTATANTTNTKGLLARVAEILDIPQEDLANAVEQARQEMKEEAPNQAMEKGLITEEQTNRIKERWESRLEAQKHLFLRARIHQGIRSRQMIAVPRGWGEPRTPGPVD